MKNYPRIHSLSTIGLIHHQENDYEFHPTRTDFMGDSASGKSIIADLLQLIFVGSTAFKSATATLKERRDPDGLVLTTPGKGTNIGYAFLNIEIASEQFVVIGVYFESTSKYTKPFIIQASTEIENGKLFPMHIPLKASDFKNDNMIFDLDELTEVMEEKQLIFKRWERISAYHRILFDNNILPLDLSANDKLLSDYAKIIQSFSRGKTLNTKESNSLLDFLFGQEKGKELYNKYVQIVKDLEATILSYGQNLDAINLLTRKYQRICSLKLLLETKNSKRQEYLTLELLYHRGEYKHLSGKISANSEKILIASHCLQQLINAATKDIIQVRKIKNSLDEDVQRTSDAQFSAKQLYTTLGDARKLIDDLKIDEKAIETVYEDYQKMKERNSILQEFTSKLLDNNIQSFFEKSEWMKGMKSGNEYFTMRINEIKSSLEDLEFLSEYIDINNPDSLVRWAISLHRPLTKIEESLVLHFQTLKRKQPENPMKRERYLPLPSVLFNRLKVEEKKNGFWIDLNGIWEYVEYVSEQRFNTIDPNVINKYFELQSQNIEQQKKQLLDERKQLYCLNDILLELTNAARAIEVYQKKDELANYEEVKLLEISMERFQSYLDCLKRKDIIEREYKQAQQKYKEAVDAQNEGKSILEKLPVKIKKAEELLCSIQNDGTLLSDIAQQFAINQSYCYDLNFYYDSDDKVDSFATEFDIQKKSIDLIESLRNDKLTFDELAVKLQYEEETYKSLYQELPADEENMNSITQEQIQQEKETYIKAKSAYDAQFEGIVNDFIVSESHLFEGESKDFVDLVAHLLPNIFGHEKVIEEEVINRIETHLKQINDKNRDLNSKKIRKIEDLLDDVYSAVSIQEDIVRKINRFFNGGKKRISGNYKLNLVKNSVKEFPINWLSAFKRRAGEQLNLFEISIADKLSSVVSIDEKILEAFKELTDNRNNDVTIDDLLNPNSYMELSLEMQDSSGKLNKGSTGQTYAAIASLCIARLSIVGSKDYNKDIGIRFMPIDEAEGLGSNFDLLYEIAQEYDYQIVTFAINPLGRYDEQFICILHRNPDVDVNINYTPMAIRYRTDIKDNLKEVIEV